MIKMKLKPIFYVLALFLVSINLRIGITSISPVLEIIRHDLNMSNFVVSFLTSIPVLCMGIFALFTGQLSNKWGSEKTIAACIILIGVATGLRAVATTSATLLFTALLVGIGIAIIGPLLSGFIKKMFPNKLGMMIGIYSVGMGLGASLSSGLTIPLQKTFGGSWNKALAIWGVLAIIAFIAWYPMIKKSVRNIENKKSGLPYKNKKAWMFTLIFGLQSGLFYCISTWLAPLAGKFGISSTNAGTVITLFTLVQMVCSFIIPTLADRFKNQKLYLIGSTIFVMAGLLFIIFEINLWVAVIFIGIALGGLFPLALVLPLNATNTAEEARAWTALMQSVGYIISGFIPIIAGLILDATGSIMNIFILLVVLSIILLCLILGIPLKETQKVSSKAS
ncbi:CynX/NimT family MFS transporter [Bacillus sp. AFS017336]|uniref:MFS transporter n=1 Tax=Bacillus sp. AFS017336 TaxID=2033489 RepID=UPI0035A13BBC